METGKWQQAEQMLQGAVEVSPDDAATRRYLAEALWKRGARKEAIAQIDEAIQLEPSDAPLMVRAGEMSLGAGAREAALAHAEHAIRLDPKLSTAWALRGRTFWQLNRPERAMADLQRSLDLSPTASDVLLDVALIYRHRGQAARSLTTLHRLLDTYTPGEEPQMALVLEGLALMDLKRPAQAVESLAAAVQKGPPSVEAYYYLAQAHSAAGQYTEAAAAVQQSLALDSTHRQSRELLAQLPQPDAMPEPQRR